MILSSPIAFVKRSLKPASEVIFAGIALAAIALFVLPVNLAFAAEPGLQPGETYVTRFSGSTHDPDGHTVIDLNGVVGSIIDVRSPGEAPIGQHWQDAPQRHPVTAAEVGQVFGIALDNASPPNIYLTATAAFGLHRTLDNSDWMNGMWGPLGGPGTIWKLNASNDYRPEVFARITLDGRSNTGPALGNIAYDKWHDQLLVSDLETGMIHRLRRSDGTELGTYDHGVTGRSNFFDVVTGANSSLVPVAFNPATAALTAACPFGNFAATPACWNFADFRRRIWGIGVRRNSASGEVRLYYAVWGSQGFGNPAWATAGDEQKNSLWSIGLDDAGDFIIDDIRREFTLPDFFDDPGDIARAGYSHPVADIAFPQCDEQNVMILAERGGVRNLGLDAENAFADPHESRVLRYEMDSQGIWQPIGRYDVGHYVRANDPQVRVNASGGAAFGFHYDRNWQLDPSKPDQFLWMTGDNLCSPEWPCPVPPDGTASNSDHVSGEQGTPVEFYNPIAPSADDNDEGPNSSYMIDTDIANDLTRNDATRIGDVEIYQPCGAGTDERTEIPGMVPPVAQCPLDFLRLDKRLAEPCQPGGPCRFTLTITNVSGQPYEGPLFLSDTPPAGAVFVLPFPPGWSCHQMAGPGSVIVCQSNPAVLPGIPPGGSISLDLTLQVPPGLPSGENLNCASIVWPMDPEPLPGGDLAEGGTWEVAWVEIALAQRGLLPWGFFDGVYDAGNPLDPTQQAIDNLLGTPPGTGTFEQAQEELFPGSSQRHADCDPENDHDCAEIPVPGGPDRPQTDLDLYKFLFQDSCQPDGWGGYLCRFGIDIMSIGPDPYSGPLHLHDNLPPGTSFQGVAAVSADLAGINCGPLGGNVVDCWLPDPPGVNIPPMQWLDIWVRVPGQLNGGLNCVSLGMPTHAGDPGVNEACAPLPNGPVPWNPPVTLGPDLSIAKTGPAQCTAGGTCTYEVSVTNNGPGVYTGPLDITDLPTGIPGVSFVSATPGWNCTVSGAVVSCHHAPVSLNIGQTETVSITLQLPGWINPDTDELSNCTWLMDVNPNVQQGGNLGTLRKYAADELGQIGGQAMERLANRLGMVRLAQADNRNAANDAERRHKRKAHMLFHRDGNMSNNKSCVRTRVRKPTRTPVPTPPPPPSIDCWSGWQQVPQGWSKPGWIVTIRRGAGVAVWCARRQARPESVPPVTPLLPHCPANYKRFDSKRLIPNDWQSFPLRLGGRVIAWCGRPVRDFRPPQCDPGWRQFPSAGRIPKGWDWTKKTRGRVTIFCARPGRREPPRKPCPDGQVRRGDRCVCPGNSVWDPKARTCRTRVRPTPIPRPCPDGQIRRGDRCVCPGNAVWNPKARTCTPRVRPIPPRCPDGQIRSGSRCICPGNTLWNQRAHKCMPRVTIRPVPKHPVRPLPKRPLPKKPIRPVTPKKVFPVRPKPQIHQIRPICTGGRVMRGTRCVCPPARPQWTGSRCVPAVR